MGLVRRQALWNTAWLYIGMGLGALNNVLLYPRFFSVEGIGLIRLLNSLASMMLLIAGLGLSNSLRRFYGYYRENPLQLRYLIRWHTKYYLMALLVVVLAFWTVLKPFIIELYQERSPLFVPYYGYAGIIFIALSLFGWLDTLALCLYRTVYTAFLKEVFLRAATALGILLFAALQWDLSDFMRYFIAEHGLMVLLALPVIRGLPWQGTAEKPQKNIHQQWWSFSLFSFLATASFTIIQNLDALMLSSMVGLGITGVYAIFSYMATVITMPSRALLRITQVIVFDAWAKKDYKTIQNLYQRTSLIKTLVGFFIFLMIVLNKEVVLWLLKKEIFAQHFTLFIVLGIGVWISVGFGLNSIILASSPKYKWDLVFNLSAIVVNGIFNYWFIKQFGGLGAAIATLFSYLWINVTKWLAVWYWFNMQPLTWKHLWGIGLLGLAFLLCWLLPSLPHPLLTLILRSFCFTILSVGFMLFFKISEDFNTLWKQWVGRWF